MSRRKARTQIHQRQVGGLSSILRVIGLKKEFPIRKGFKTLTLKAYAVSILN